MTQLVAVLAGTHQPQVSAALADRLQLPLVDAKAGTAYPLLLGFVEQRLSLWQTGEKMPGPVWVDFSAGAMAHRRKAGQNELLGKAVGVKQGRCPTVWDATAGLGRDSFVLADSGCTVYACERSAIVAALLADGIARAQLLEHSAEAAARMQLVTADSLAATVPDSVEVIYLDPMFPARKKSAQVKKDMQVLQLLPGTGASGEALLPWAMAQDVARVVVKRPLRAPFLTAAKPSHSIRGKAVRFDVYVKRALA
ncbi:MAG: hypothetical protein CSA53_05255 [Gammaproteobacteria bacterium]|nr:MAG: hypothetical protein CSA53_05255 [Gammaproteobacteria bacterium]